MGGIEGRILDSLGWGVMVIGRWNRRILAYNRRMAEIAMGICAQDAVGREVGEVFSYLRGLDLEAIDAEIRETGGFEARSLRLVRPDGEVVYRHLRGDVLQGGFEGEDAVVASVQDVTDKEHMRLCLSRYLASEVMDLLLASRGEQRLAGREVDAAVLVADMRNFTGAAEGLTPEELFETLNAYLDPLVEVVVRHRGMIDKFTGDGFMAVFGIPEPRGDESARALSAALDLSREVERLGAERGARGLPCVEVGYGIHWGPALAGSLGSSLRMEYTVVGDTVNIAHRVQSLAGPGQILATRAAAKAAGDGFQWGEDQWVRIRGRKAPVKVQPLLGREG